MTFVGGSRDGAWPLITREWSPSVYQFRPVDAPLGTWEAGLTLMREAAFGAYSPACGSFSRFNNA
jgi:hypothetical protein